MPEIRTNNYEAMFLLSQSVATDLGGAVDHIRQILDRAGATVIAMKKWDERRLAYEINKQKRGVYILVYFSCPNSGLALIERASNLSERILRHLILRVDHMTLDEMRAADAQKELETEARLRAERTTKAPGEETPVTSVTPAAAPLGAGAAPEAAPAPEAARA